VPYRTELQIALLVVGMIVWGYVLWWRRGPGRRPGHVPADGVLRSLPRGLDRDSVGKVFQAVPDVRADLICSLMVLISLLWFSMIDS